MASYDDLYGSRFLSATELKAPVTAVIERIDEETLGRGAEARTKVVLYAKGAKKGIVVNKTNARTLADAFGKDFNAWPGHQITVKAEPTTFGGKSTLGVRIYPVNGAISAPKAPEAPKPMAEEMNDSIPW
jgi:hypothetical protein